MRKILSRENILDSCLVSPVQPLFDSIFSQAAKFHCCIFLSAKKKKKVVHVQSFSGFTSYAGLLCNMLNPVHLMHVKPFFFFVLNSSLTPKDGSFEKKKNNSSVYILKSA